MAEPTGKVVARPMIARACGHLQEFQHYAVDKYRAQRQAKFQSTRCTTCVEKHNEEQRQAAAALPKKGEAIESLPKGTQISLVRKPDGNWKGTLNADGIQVDGEGDGPQGVTVAMARSWLARRRPK
jgi:hypothetical protein